MLSICQTIHSEHCNTELILYTCSLLSCNTKVRARAICEWLVCEYYLLHVKGRVPPPLLPCSILVFWLVNPSSKSLPWSPPSLPPFPTIHIAKIQHSLAFAVLTHSATAHPHPTQRRPTSCVMCGVDSCAWVGAIV